jgi:hypothetical protein
MKYIRESIPATSRWHNIFIRYIHQIEDRVRGFGGDPGSVKPSPDGGEGSRHHREDSDDREGEDESARPAISSESG